MFRCPGQDQRYWKPEDIFEVNCPCGGLLEFFKDEPKLRCKKCGRIITNPRIDLGCAEWCQYAEQCIGRASAKDINSICDRLVERMKGVFGDDYRRIDHSLAVLGYAKRIGAVEGGDPLVLRAAAILHDVGIPRAEQKHGSTDGRFQELEGPPIARDIMGQFDLDPAVVEHVCRIIANHHGAKDIDTIEFRCLWDADQIANILAESPDGDPEQIRRKIMGVLKTGAGRKVAEEILSAGDAGRLDHKQEVN